MLKKENDLKWYEEARKSCHALNPALTIAPILISPDYSNDFIIFSFASKHTMATILM